MNSTDTTTPASQQFAVLKVLFAAVAAAAGLPGTATAFNPPPPMPIPCNPGSWSNSGRTPCQLADAGHFVATAGATSQTPAPLGSYVDTTGAVAATLAPLGRYVDTMGASSAKLASPGSYVDTTGQTAPLPAPAGRFAAGWGSAAAAPCPTGTNSYGAGSACRIVQEGHQGAGVTPLLGSTFGTGGSHDLGSGDSFSFNVTNTSADLATPGNLTALTLLSYTFSDPGLFDLVGFNSGVELAAGGGLAALSLRAKDGLPAGAFSLSLTLNTDQYANFQTAGKQFSYTFTGLNATPVPEPGPVAMLLAGLGVLALLRRRTVPPRPLHPGRQ